MAGYRSFLPFGLTYQDSQCVCMEQTHTFLRTGSGISRTPGHAGLCSASGVVLGSWCLFQEHCPRKAFLLKKIDY